MVKQGARERGLELSSVSIIDLQANTAYQLDAQQTLENSDHSCVERASLTYQDICCYG